MERNKAKLDTGSDSFGEVSLNSISWSNWVLFKDSVCPEPAQAPGFSICLSFLPLLLPCCLSWPWLVSAVKRLLRTLSTLKGDLYFRIWNVFLQKTVIGFLWKETQSKMGWCYRNSSFFFLALELWAGGYFQDCSIHRWVMLPVSYGIRVIYFFFFFFGL